MMVDYTTAFKKQVSWVKRYEDISQILLHPTSRVQHTLCKIVTDTDSTVEAIFCTSNTFWDVIGWGKGQPLWVIVQDYMEPMEIDRFMYTSREYTVPYFMDVKSQLHYNTLICNALDGVLQTYYMKEVTHNGRV